MILKNHIVLTSCSIYYLCSQAEASRFSEGDYETDDEYLESVSSREDSPDRGSRRYSDGGSPPRSPYQIRPVAEPPLESSPIPGRHSPISSHISRDSRLSPRRLPTSRDSSTTRSVSPSRGEPVSGRMTPASMVSLDWDNYTGNTSSQLESSGDSWRYRPRQDVDVQQVREAIDECTMRLEATENSLRCRTPTGAEVEEEKEGYVSDIIIMVCLHNRPMPLYSNLGKTC